MNGLKFGFIFSMLANFADIYEFEDATWYASGCGYGETAREAIVDACTSAYRDCTLWEVPRNPVGYLVEFDVDGNVVNVERQTLCIVGETTYTLEFAEDDKKTFFKATNQQKSPWACSKGLCVQDVNKNLSLTAGCRSGIIVFSPNEGA